MHFPLGKWLRSGDQLCREWPYYYDYETGELYVRQLVGYLRCIATDPIRFLPISTNEWQPTSLSTPVHAHLTIKGDAWIPIIPSPPTSAPCEPCSATFVEFLDSLEFWETKLFSDLTLQFDCYKIIELINNQRRRNTEIELLTSDDVWLDNCAPGWYSLSTVLGPCLRPFWHILPC